MCGIIGLFTRESPIEASDLQRMRQALTRLLYRGPDGSGIWSTERVLLGHRRLSIIDLSPAGAQPFVDPERSLVITFNGEIYNYQDLRDELIAQGYTFRTRTDTEVILCAYDRYGIDFLPRLQGMFAFALYDQKKNAVILARDPAGEKPLYYWLDSNRLVFASEVKAFHAFPELSLSIDEEAVRAFFVLQYVPGPHTIYKQVRKLPAGTLLELDLSAWSNRESRYWLFERKAPGAPTSEEIEDALYRSVRYRLIADVEVGLLLSGGVDSSLLAWYTHQTGASLRAFSARFERDDLDEMDYSRQVAEYLGMEQVVVDGGELAGDTFEEVVFHADEPLGDAACIPTYLLARQISKHVKVVLSGEGADELFWGYDSYRLERIWRWFSWVRALFSGARGAADMISGWEAGRQVPPAITRLGKLLSARYDLGASRWTSVFADNTLRLLVPSRGGEAEGAYLEEMEQRLHQLEPGLGGYEAALAGDLIYWLADDLLVKVDRMTMAHSVEARAPFLDPRLISMALALPQREKLNGGAGKLILRNLVEKHFPAELGSALAWRRKHGFEVPLNEWLRGSLRECVEDRLSPAKVLNSGLLSVPFVTELKRQFYSSEEDTPLRRKMWLLLCFQSWHDLHESGFGFR